LGRYDGSPDREEWNHVATELTIRIKKKGDGSAALTCVRDDGSATWQRKEGLQGQFFPLHDLAHYAVEVELGHVRGFYGLIAEGWDLTDFGKPWPRGPIPPDADPTELIVGFFDAERMTGVVRNAAELNRDVDLFLRKFGVPSRSNVTDADLGRIRARLQSLFERWSALPCGDTLELHFARSPSAVR
jgi:hypothetical protein